MRPFLFLLLWVVLLGAGGCGGAGYLAHMVAGPDKVEAAYELQERPTLILVDDPGQLFTDSNLPLTVATHIEHHLNLNNKMESMIISSRKLVDLQVELGDAYALTPMDQLARRVGAEQVIYVRVESLSMESGPGMYHPTAMVRVKVVDAMTGDRLFPPAPSRGHSVVTQTTYRGLGDSGVSTVVVLRRALAEAVGQDVAKLFYKWTKPEIGSRLHRP